MSINKETLFPFLIYNRAYKYNENITLQPVTMDNVVLFQMLSPSITIRKNSMFHDKQIIKMTYLDFLIYSFRNDKLEKEYNIIGLSQYFLLAIQLLDLCCKEKASLSDTGRICINGQEITPQTFDDIRRIIIIQNGIDFDVDEFLNYDTEKRLLKAQKDIHKESYNVNIEDYIDSLIIAMNITEEQVMCMTIRKFWRYIKRYQLHEGYTIAKTGEFSGMVSFKNPIKHWMASLEEDDKYKDLKTDENSLKGKINGSNI